MAKLTALGVFCGGGEGNNPELVKTAARLGKYLAVNKIDLVYGSGFTGIMGAVVREAKKYGGRIVGVITKHLQESEHPPFPIDELIVVSTMQIRKDIMINRSDAFCVLPGGIGTLDELFEIITLRQIGEMNKPIILANIDGFWNHADGLLKEMIARGFAKEKHRYLYKMVDKIEDVIPAIEEELAQPDI